MSKPLHDQIEVIESGYEFLLAYAAQGRASDTSPSGHSEVRSTLTGMLEAAGNIRNALKDREHEFAAVTRDDARKAAAAIDVVISQENVSSELVDNLNASIHLRALLTDLFLLAESNF